MNLYSVSISTSLYISRRPQQGGPAFFNTDVTSILYNNALGGDSGVARGGARGAVAPGAELRGALKSWGKKFFGYF